MHDLRDRREVLHRVVGQVLAQVGRDGRGRRRPCDQRVAIGSGLGDGLRADQTARADRRNAMLAALERFDDWRPIVAGAGAINTFAAPAVVTPALKLPPAKPRPDLLDKDSAPGRLVFNRAVTLRDTWAKMQKKK